MMKHTLSLCLLGLFAFLPLTAAEESAPLTVESSEETLMKLLKKDAKPLRRALSLKRRPCVEFSDFEEARERIKAARISPQQALESVVGRYAGEAGGLCHAVKNGKTSLCYVFHEYYFFPRRLCYKMRRETLSGFFVHMHTGEMIYVDGGYDMIMPYGWQESRLLFQDAK